MRTNEPKTPLLALLRALTPAQRERLAKDAGTRVDYLYKLATCARKPGLVLAIRIEVAALKMHRRIGSAVITMTDLSTMCDCQD